MTIRVFLLQVHNRTVLQFISTATATAASRNTTMSVSVFISYTYDRTLCQLVSMLLARWCCEIVTLSSSAVKYKMNTKKEKSFPDTGLIPVSEFSQDATASRT